MIGIVEQHFLRLTLRELGNNGRKIIMKVLMQMGQPGRIVPFTGLDISPPDLKRQPRRQKQFSGFHEARVWKWPPAPRVGVASGDLAIFVCSQGPRKIYCSRELPRRSFSKELTFLSKCLTLNSFSGGLQ